jgi:hypothetical protein
MSFTELLSHFERVRRTGPDKALARCPHHHDRNPSLSIRLTRDGQKFLIHCFAGCSTEAILHDVDLGWGDCFADGAPNRRVCLASPRKQRGHKKYWDRLGETDAEPFTLLDVLRAIERRERARENVMGQ